MTKKDIWKLCNRIIPFNWKCDLCGCDLENKKVITLTTNLKKDNYAISICKDCFMCENRIHCYNCNKDITNDNLWCAECMEDGKEVNSE